MSDIEPPDGPGRDAPNLSAHLQRIAAALGCSVETFYAPPGTDPLDGAAELLRLWRAIPDEAGRARVLAAARAAAGEPGTP